MDAPPVQLVHVPGLAFDPKVKKRLQTTSNWKMVAGVALLIAFFLTPTTIPPGTFQDIAMCLFGPGAMIAWIMGCLDYIKSKGYSASYGLLGVLGLIGLILLLALPDKWPLPKAAR